MKKYLGLSVLMSTLFFTSCKTKNEQLDCFNHSMKDIKLKPLLNDLQKGLNDTLNDWIFSKKYINVQILTRVSWKVDESIFLNPKKDKAILLLLEQDTAKYTCIPSDSFGIPEIIKPTSYDDIALIFANKENDGWHYYYQSMELWIIPREKKVNGTPVPLTFEELSLTGRRNVLMNYYKRGTCIYNEKFFDNWDITNLKEQHKDINGYF
jgi:hypothetical protein